MKICVVMATYNRIELTRRSLEQLAGGFPPSTDYQVFVVDGGSTDGTELISEIDFSHVTLYKVDGAYWNQGMRYGIEEALKREFSHFLLLNDDVSILEHGISRLLNEYQSHGDSVILVGRCIDPTSQITSYGALKRKSSYSKLRFRLLREGEIYGDTFNGNCVLVSREIFREIGNLNSYYLHSMGDIDFGLRASKKGIKIVQMQHPFGELAYNREWATRNTKLRFRNWKSILIDPKGVRIDEWLLFCRTHGGVLWPLNFVFRYIRMLLP